MTNTYNTLACTLLFACFASAERIHANDSIKEIEAIRSNFMEQAMDARKDYRNELRRHARIAVSKLEKVANSAVREGDLPAATKAMKQVLWLDRENSKAVAHFKAIGRLDEVLKELEDMPALPQSSAGAGNEASSEEISRQLIGTAWTWGETTIVFAPGGRATGSKDSQPNLRRWGIDNQRIAYVTGPNESSGICILRFEEDLKTYEGKTYTLKSSDFPGKRVR